MPGLPPATELSTLGISFIALFAVWKIGLAPRLARRRHAQTSA